VCIVDTDQRSLNDIRISLEQIDGSLKLFEFSDLEGLQKWITENLKNLSENPNAEKIEIKLIVGDLKFIGPKYFGLLEKVRKLFIRSSLCTAVDPTGFVLTAFESPNLDHKLMEDSLISNVLFKPFDKAILLQHLRVALVGHHSVTDSSVFKQKVKVQAEMLKEIQMVEYSEIGFKTKSDRAVQINSVAKYYGIDLFQSGRSFVFARCVRCSPVSSLSNDFNVEFEFFGLANAKNKFIRQTLFKSHDEAKASQVKDKSSKQEIAKVNVVLIQDVENTEIKEFLEKKYRNIEVEIILDEAKMTETYKDKKSIHAVIVNLKEFEKESLQKWKAVVDHTAGMINTGIVFLATINREFNDTDKNEFSDMMTDIVQIPLDRTYLFKRISHWLPQLVTAEEEVSCLSKKVEKVLKVASPVDLVEISEAGLSMKYYREIEHNSFRRFSLGTADSSDAPEILGTCYFHEKVGDAYVNHFVFFGITDHYLKKIRKWILDSYILTKQSA
jgi:hypothetical protein